MFYQLGEGGSLTFSVTVAAAPNWACRRVGVNTQLPGSVGVYHATCLLNGVGRGTEPVVHRTAVSRPVSDKGLVTSDKSTQHALVGTGSRFLPGHQQQHLRHRKWVPIFYLAFYRQAKGENHTIQHASEKCKKFFVRKRNGQKR